MFEDLLFKIAKIKGKAEARTKAQGRMKKRVCRLRLTLLTSAKQGPSPLENIERELKG
jgi:folate-binding Fe-S cluster repair protein YgfZ